MSQLAMPQGGPSPVGPNQPAGQRRDRKKDVSPKVHAAALGAAVSTFLWIPAGHFLHGLSQGEVSSMTSATCTILAWGLGYWVRDPIRS
jgi:hypothetical protein